MINAESTGATEATPRQIVEGFVLAIQLLHRHLKLLLALSLSAICAATAGRGDEQDSDVPRRNGPTTKDYPSLHNLITVTDKIYSGAEPDDDEAFESLRALGVKTVISVDGARPDVATAHKHGLRYVHIPIGYDGVTRDAGAALARVVREAKAPIYVHCHHGQHRGPTAAAVACIASGAADGRKAIKILERAGTGKEYPGLWRDVAAYRPPLNDARLPALKEVAEVDTLPAAMALIDRAFDELKLSQQADWSVPPNHRDLAPATQATLVREQFHEASRLLSGQHDARLKEWLSAAEARSRDLEAALRGDDKTQATRCFQQLQNACKQCHAAYRN
jgi:protein tyrosine phosphatase (PTP) superfamily phosphohydrolase (DUF442 family)